MKHVRVPGTERMARGVSFRRLRRLHGKEVAQIAEEAMRCAKKRGHKPGMLMDCGGTGLRLKARCMKEGCGCAVMVAPDRAAVDGAGFGGSAIENRCPTANPIGLRRNEMSDGKKKRTKKAEAGIGTETVPVEVQVEQPAPKRKRKAAEPQAEATKVQKPSPPPFKPRKPKVDIEPPVEATKDLKQVVARAKKAKAEAVERQKVKTEEAKQRRHKHDIVPFKGKLPVEENPSLKFLGKVGNDLYVYEKTFKSGTTWNYYFTLDGKRFESVPAAERYLEELAKAA
jgi:hypothetical protein